MMAILKKGPARFLVLFCLLGFVHVTALAETNLSAQWKTMERELSRRISGSDGLIDEQSLEMARQLIQVAEQTYGIVSFRAATSHYFLGFIHRRRAENNPQTANAEYSQAVAAFTRAVEIQEKLPVEDLSKSLMPTLAFYLSDLGDAYKAQGAWAKASTQYERSIEVIERTMGPDVSGLSNSFESLAITSYEQGDYAKSAAAFLRVLDLAERHGYRKETIDRYTYNLGVLGRNALTRGNAVNAIPLLELQVAQLQKSGRASPDDLAKARQSLDTARRQVGTRTASSSAKGSPQKNSAECAAKEQQVKNTKVPPNSSITASTETVMFMTKTAMEMFDAGCPGVTYVEWQRYKQSYESAEQACNAVQSGGHRCAAKNHFGSGSGNQPAVAGADGCEGVNATALAQMRKVTKNGSPYTNEPSKWLADTLGHISRTPEQCEWAMNNFKGSSGGVAIARKDYDKAREDYDKALKRYDSPNHAYFQSRIDTYAYGIERTIAEQLINTARVCKACGPVAVPSNLGVTQGGGTSDLRGNSGSSSASSNNSPSSDSTCGPSGKGVCWAR